MEPSATVRWLVGGAAAAVAAYCIYQNADQQTSDGPIQMGDIGTERGNHYKEVVAARLEWLKESLQVAFPGASFEAPLAPTGMGCRLNGVDVRRCVVPGQHPSSQLALVISAICAGLLALVFSWVFLVP
jgi:hypothetical protein